MHERRYWQIIRKLILRVLQLRFDESLSYHSAQTGVSKTAIFSLVRRFHQVFTDWPLSGKYSCGQLARALFPGRYPSTPTVTQPVKAEKPRRNRFSPEFKWRLVQRTLLPGACVAQIARENGINDNLLFNWPISGVTAACSRPANMKHRDFPCRLLRSRIIKSRHQCRYLNR